ncbi:MAG: DNA-binding GntR family transcriptional regulator [Granulosicoccus sp.]|jgi:DNA-binding GntR family transcriptional regulator
MKIQAITVGACTYQKIKHDIIFGELEPGLKLKLDGLKARYQASLTTLREILNRLASEGFVVAEEQRGFFVTQVSKSDLTEIANLRVLLECHALDHSISQGDADWEGNLVAAHHKLHIAEKQMLDDENSSKELWKRYDWEFHLALIQACNSSNLLSLHAILFEKYMRYQMLVLTNRDEKAVLDHRAIFDAAMARDSARAQTLLETHIITGLKYTLERM